MDSDARPTSPPEKEALTLKLPPEPVRLSVMFGEVGDGSFNVRCGAAARGLRPDFSKSTAVLLNVRRGMKRPIKVAGYNLFPFVSVKIECDVPEEMRQTVSDNLILDWIHLSSPMRKD